MDKTSELKFCSEMKPGLEYGGHVVIDEDEMYQRGQKESIQ